MNQSQIYLDYAAATPLDEAVFLAMKPYFSADFYNPSATYLAAKSVKKDLEAARASVAATLGVKPLEITFTAGGTEANNLAINGVMQAFPGKKIVISSVEHDSVLAPANQYDSALVSVKNDGSVDLNQLEKLIDDDTILVSVMMANNEVGTIQPITKISGLINKIRLHRKQGSNDLPLYLHTDACQAGLYLDLHVSRLGVDMLTLNGGKIYGPKQSGVLYVKSGVRLNPQILGGGQERGRRSGTENIAFAVGLALALKKAQTGRVNEGKRLQDLQKKFIDNLVEAIPGIVINGSRKNRLPNNIHLTISGVDNESALFALDEQGIMAAAGSACSASNEESSHVLRAMGVSDGDARSSLRLTIGRSTNLQTVETVTKALQTVASRLA